MSTLSDGHQRDSSRAQLSGRGKKGREGGREGRERGKERRREGGKERRSEGGSERGEGMRRDRVRDKNEGRGGASGQGLQLTRLAVSTASHSVCIPHTHVHTSCIHARHQRT